MNLSPEVLEQLKRLKIETTNKEYKEKTHLYFQDINGEEHEIDLDKPVSKDVYDFYANVMFPLGRTFKGNSEDAFDMWNIRLMNQGFIERDGEYYFVFGSADGGNYIFVTPIYHEGGDLKVMKFDHYQPEQTAREFEVKRFRRLSKFLEALDNA